MTVRFQVTIDLHGVPTVRHVRDIEETIWLAVRRLCCQRDDSLRIESRSLAAVPESDANLPARRPVLSESGSSSETVDVEWERAQENVA